MKKLNLKDLQLSPKVVTDLTGGTFGAKGYTVPVVCTDTGTCNQSVADSCKSDNNQCLSKADNACASDNCSEEPCVKTLKESCVCTDLCNLTHSQDVQCCEATKLEFSACCPVIPNSVQVCPDTYEGLGCAASDLCNETVNCLDPATVGTC